MGSGALRRQAALTPRSAGTGLPLTAAHGSLAHCERGLKIHKCHSVNTSVIVIAEAALRSLLLPQGGGKATHTGSPL